MGQHHRLPARRRGLLAEGLADRHPCGEAGGEAADEAIEGGPPVRARGLEDDVVRHALEGGRRRRGTALDGHDEGGEIHDLQVMRKPPSGDMELIGQVQGLRMGEAKALTLELQPGEYELSCNVVEEVGGRTISHYKEGMVASFTVTG